MPAQLLLISRNPDDEKLGRYIAHTAGFPLSRLTKADEIAQSPAGSAAVAHVLSEHISPFKVFACTDGPLNESPHLFNNLVFGHHFFRRYHNPAPQIYSKLIAAALSPYPFGLLRFFPRGTTSQKLQIKRSGQKNAAVEAIRNFLLKKGVITRLATLGAQALDELIMNAIFDAPVTQDGTAFRRNRSRDEDFELKEEGAIEIELATFADGYTGICVADQFGSFRKPELMKYLAKNFQENAYVVRSTDPGAGLGINGMIQSGLSMLFVAKPGSRTEVMVFFANSPNYKIFRSNGFRFISILGA